MKRGFPETFLFFRAKLDGPTREWPTAASGGLATIEPQRMLFDTVIFSTELPELPSSFGTTWNTSPPGSNKVSLTKLTSLTLFFDVIPILSSPPTYFHVV